MEAAKLPDFGEKVAQFRVLAELGRGGMGVVYRAFDESLRRDVALKVLPPDVVSDVGRRRRFLNEARAAASVTHPNIAVVHEVGEDNGYIFIAMELVAGRSLRSRLLEGPPPLEEVLRLARSIARALGRAHDQGLVHRDLKPENVIVGDDDLVKVLDFGIAKWTTDDASPVEPSAPTATAPAALTGEGVVIGTPGYMSPEQAIGRLVDVRSDVFSFGVVLHELLEGTRPFQRTNPVEEVVALTRDPPAPVRRPDVPEALLTLLTQCLEKDPAKRPATGRDLVAGLDAMRTAGARTPGPTAPVGATPAATAQGRSSSVPRWMKRVAVATLAVAAGYGALRVRPGAPTADRASATATAVTVTDHPAPESSSAEAKAAYASGMRQLRDGNWPKATTAFQRAEALDTTMAASHLRLALVGAIDNDPELARRHFGTAHALRDRLTERDRALLDALEPIAQRLRGSRTEAARRLTELTRRYPTDAEIHMLLAVVHMGDPEAALRAATRSTDLDPAYADGWQLKGEMLQMLGRVDEARSAYERGAGLTSASADVLSWLSALEANAGRCDALEAAERRLFDRGSLSTTPMLAAALHAKGAPLDTLREALRQHWTVQEPPRQHKTQLADEARLAAVTGDFETARERWTALVETAAASNDLLPHYDPTAELVRLAIETGRDADAASLAYEFATRYDVWSQPSTLHPIIGAYIPWILRVATRSGQLSTEQFDAKRRAWIETNRTVSNVAPGLLWTFGHAGAAETAEQATEAKALAAEFAPLGLSSLRGLDLTTGTLGHYHLLAGDQPAALRELRQAAASCASLVRPFLDTWALLDYGRALELEKDRPGACKAYVRILSRWGDAKPRSVTAEAARERQTALGCDR